MHHVWAVTQNTGRSCFRPAVCALLWMMLGLRPRGRPWSLGPSGLSAVLTPETQGRATACKFTPKGALKHSAGSEPFQQGGCKARKPSEGFDANARPDRKRGQDRLDTQQLRPLPEEPPGPGARRLWFVVHGKEASTLCSSVLFFHKLNMHFAKLKKKSQESKGQKKKKN